ncbi:hypothetical protein RFF05_08295 [Bengtsoniella intestinalis]|uniref:hypothetical protein n=1 Tax=Bengtsoniella intestinalis TaxID=3073143 RepID=UPI00391F3073
MKKQLKYAIYLCVFALCVMGFLNTYSFSSTISQTIPATVYKDGVAVEETTVTIEGKRTNYLFHDNERYTGTFAIDCMEWTTRDTQSVLITWDNDDHLQKFSYWDYPPEIQDDICYHMLISDDMTQFGLLRRDGAFITTAPEVLALMEKHFALNNTSGASVSDVQLIPPLETLEPIPTLTEADLLETTTEIAPAETIEVKKVIYTQMADVTHDGIDDVIETSITILSDMQDKTLKALLKMTIPCDIAVYDTTLSTNKPIYEQSYGAPHTANGQLSLVEVDGLFYLLEGSLYAGQGAYTFVHSIFSLDNQGNRQVQTEDSAEGQLSDGDAASKIQAYFSNLTPWIESATAIAILDINLENQMVSTENESYLAKDYYEAMSVYYSEMTDEYALLG